MYLYSACFSNEESATACRIRKCVYLFFIMCIKLASLTATSLIVKVLKHQGFILMKLSDTLK